MGDFVHKKCALAAKRILSKSHSSLMKRLI